MYKKSLYTTLFALICLFALANTKLFTLKDLENEKRETWVDSVFNSLTEDQKLGQLFMVAAYSNKDEKHASEIETLVKDYHVGGIIFMQGGPLRQANLCNRFQSSAKVPLLISMDAEWGLSMRLDSTIVFPRQMTLGALKDNQLIYRMGKEIAQQCKRLGVHVSFSPAVDVNSNPNNPVIGQRSFGENKELVAEKALAYMHGLQKNGVIAVAKHFPGHGDTDTDSHHTLPFISHSKKRIDEIDLYPFKKLIKDSLAGVMVAHLQIPAYDNEPNKASTLSKEIVKNLLIDKLNFEGLIFTDALNMKGVSIYFKPGEVDLMALKAGNDILLFSEDVPTAILKIKEAIAKGYIPQKEIDRRVKKILKAKYWAGLHKYQPVELKNLYEDLNNADAKALRYTLFEKSATLVSNDDSLLPLSHLDTTHFASMVFGLGADNDFQKLLNKYAPFENYHYTDDFKFNEEQIKWICDKLAGKTVVVSLNHLNSVPAKSFGVTNEMQKVIQRLNEKSKVVLCVFGSPYSLKFFSDTKTIICAFENNEVTRKVLPQILFGAHAVNGKLPVSSGNKFKEGRGIGLNKVGRLQYSIPEKVGLNPLFLSRIDTIVKKAIKNHVMPGCQILIAKAGKVIYNQNFGYLTYDTTNAVNDSTLYDIASISKVAGTLQGIMFLYDQGLISLDSAASVYLHELKNTNKQNIVIKEALTHVTGFQAFIDHYRRTMDNGKLSDFYYCDIQDSVFSVPVTPTLFLKKSIPDSMWKWSIDSHLIAKQKTGDTSCYPYRYSDISFYLLKNVFEKVINQPQNEFLKHHFYEPMGMYSTCYTPLQHQFPLKHIAPTEHDTYFRKQIIRGTVHDPGAAMLGGVAGHAGLFSNANDLAKLMQMHLQKGYYGGIQYLKPETVLQFTKPTFSFCRRGLGWDKPQLGNASSPTSDYCSLETFGHTGFTGTCVWADPKYDLIFIFLSNRTYPNSENKKLITQSIRTRIQDEIYRAIIHDSSWKELE